MKKILKKTSIATLAITSMVGASVIATPVLEKVAAYYNQGIVYTLDGQTVLDGKGGVVYNDSIYVPIRAVSEALGVDVSYENGVVIMNRAAAVEDAVLEDVLVDSDVIAPLENVFIESVDIVEIDTEGKRLTVVPTGKEAVFENFIILNVSDQTVITHEEVRPIFDFSTLKEGMKVKVEHSPIMTMSLPGQTAAVALTILGDVPDME